MSDNNFKLRIIIMFTKLKIAALKAAKAVSFIAIFVTLSIAGGYIILGLIVFNTVLAVFSLVRSLFGRSKNITNMPALVAA